MRHNIKILQLTVIPAAVLIMSGCGGGTGIVQPTYNQLYDEFYDISDRLDGSASDISDPASLPTNGTATYEGPFFVNVPRSAGVEETVMGEMELNVNFEASSIDGQVENFVGQADNDYSGSLDIENGAIYRHIDPADSYTFATDINGTLTDQDGSNTSVDATLLGDFYGDRAEYAAGTIYGTVTTQDGTFAYDQNGAGFVAEKQ